MTQLTTDVEYLIDLRHVPNIGNAAARSLIAYCGSAKDVFKKPGPQLLKIPGIGPKMVQSIKGFKQLELIRKELDFIQKNQIDFIPYYSNMYPKRLKDLLDAPLYLFYSGNADLNPSRSIAIIGTRKPSNYGKAVIRNLLKDLGKYKCTVVSGLAYGIDTLAHKYALENALPTLAVMGNGLKRIYPSQNRKLATEIQSNGALLTEFVSDTGPDRENFPQRNRIVAGMSDATIIIETGVKGGSMITAEIAYSYQRDVMAFPGDINREESKGCNKLVKIQKAVLIESAEDIAWNLGWDIQNAESSKGASFRTLENLNEKERSIMQLLDDNQRIHIDKIRQAFQENSAELAGELLNLELKGLIKPLPGSYYQKY